MINFIFPGMVSRKLFSISDTNECKAEEPNCHFKIMKIHLKINVHLDVYIILTPVSS